MAVLAELNWDGGIFSEASTQRSLIDAGAVVTSWLEAWSSSRQSSSPCSSLKWSVDRRLLRSLRDGSRISPSYSGSCMNSISLWIISGAVDAIVSNVFVAVAEVFSFLVLTTVVQGAGSSQVIAGALPVPGTAVGGAEFILIANWPSVKILFNQKLIVAPESNTVLTRLLLKPYRSMYR